MCVYPPFLSTRPSDRNQILHTYSDRYGTHSHLNKLAPRMARKAGLIGNNLRNLTGGVRQRDDLGPTAWNCHLHPSLRFSGSSNHLIHVSSLCPPKLLHLGTQHSVPCLFFLRLSMPPTATHQQDNSYGGSAIWRVSKFVIPLIIFTVLLKDSICVVLLKPVFLAGCWRRRLRTTRSRSGSYLTSLF